MRKHTLGLCVIKINIRARNQIIERLLKISVWMLRLTFESLPSALVESSL